MSNPRDFQGFKNRQERRTDGIPIIGQPSAAPPQALDALGRVLEVGDFIDVRNAVRQPFRVMAIEDAGVLMTPQGPAPALSVRLQSVEVYHAPKGQQNPEFMRVMTKAEAEAYRPPQPPTDTVDTSGKGAAVEDAVEPTLKDA